MRIKCITISEERCQGLQTWILNSFKELHNAQAQRLAVAGVIIEEIRNSIYRETGFRCSAGIAQNKASTFFIFSVVCYALHILMIWILIECFDQFIDIGKVGMRITQTESPNDFTRSSRSESLFDTSGKKSPKSRREVWRCRSRVSRLQRYGRFAAVLLRTITRAL